MRILKLSSLVVALAVACGAQAQTFELKRGAADLVPDTLVAAKSMPAGGAQETRAVHFAWALEADAALTQAAPHHAESREFWTQLDASQAKSGWDFTPTTDGALVRISLRQSGKARSLAASDLQLRVDGQVRDAASVIEHLAGDAELKSVGTHFSEGTVVFQLAKGLAGKRIGVALPDSASSALMHVLEPDSPVSMALAADRIQALPGGRIVLDAGFMDGDKKLPAGRMAGLVTAPDGRSFDVDFRVDKSGRATASFQLPEDAIGGMEPWEIHVFGAAKLGRGQQVLRDARTAVMVSLPSARLLGVAGLKRKDGGLNFDLPVEVAADGRFEVRGTLHGTDKSGQLRPMAIAHGADVLKAGAGTLALRFPADVLNAKLGAPYALRDLSLSDQTRLSLNEHRHEALDIPVLP